MVCVFDRGQLEEKIIQEETAKLLNSKELKKYYVWQELGSVIQETKSNGGKIGSKLTQAEKKMYLEETIHYGLMMPQLIHLFFFFLFLWGEKKYGDKQKKIWDI